MRRLHLDFHSNTVVIAIIYSILWQGRDAYLHLLMWTWSPLGQLLVF